MGNKYDYRQLREFINANHDRFSELNYDTSLSTTQKMTSLVDWFKVLLKEYKEWVQYLDDFKEKFDENLYTTVDDILTKWVEDGILMDVVNKVFKEQNDKIDKNNKDQNDKIEKYNANNIAQLTTKVDKNGLGQIYRQNLSQDVLSMFTGDKTAIVGTESVSLIQFAERIQNDIGEFITQTISPQNQNYIITAGKAVLGDSTNYNSIMLGTSEGERFKVTVRTGGTQTPSVMYVKNDMTVIGTDLFPGDGTNTIYSDYEIKVPSGTNRLILQSFYTTPIILKRLTYQPIINKNFLESYQTPLENTVATEPEISYEIGGLASSNGGLTTATNRLRTTEKIFMRKNSVINFLDGCIANIMIYNVDDSKSYSHSVLSSGLSTIKNHIIESDCYVKFVISYPDNRDLVNSDVSVLSKLVQARFKADLSALYDKQELEIIRTPFMKTNLELEYGSVSGTTGENIINADNARIRTKDYVFFPKGSVITTDTTKCRIAILSYNVETKEFIESILGGGVLIAEKYTAEKDMLIKIVFANFSTSTPIESVESMIPNFNIYLGQTYSYLNRKINEVSSVAGLIEESTNGYKLTKKLDIGGQSDHTFIGDELWVFQPSEDTNTEYKNVYRYKINFSDLSFTQLTTIQHNLGHCNTVDYCDENDTLILGNGSSDYALQGKIIIIPSFKTRFSNSSRINLSDCLVIDCSQFNLGKKFNLVWADGGLATYDMAYLITDDTATIRKIQLGKGTNDLGMGTIIQNKGNNEFNGTFKIVETHIQETRGYDDVIQGGQYYKNILYTNIGHYGINWWENTLIKNQKIKRKNVLNIPYDETGLDVGSTYYSIGIAIKNDFIFYGTFGMMLVYKL